MSEEIKEEKGMRRLYATALEGVGVLMDSNELLAVLERKRRRGLGHHAVNGALNDHW